MNALSFQKLSLRLTLSLQQVTNGCFYVLLVVLVSALVAEDAAADSVSENAAVPNVQRDTKGC